MPMIIADIANHILVFSTILSFLLILNPPPML
jgi:hypothetical protein